MARQRGGRQSPEQRLFNLLTSLAYNRQLAYDREKLIDIGCDYLRKIKVQDKIEEIISDIEKNPPEVGGKTVTFPSKLKGIVLSFGRHAVRLALDHGDVEYLKRNKEALATDWSTKTGIPKEIFTTVIDKIIQKWDDIMRVMTEDVKDKVEPIVDKVMEYVRKKKLEEVGLYLAECLEKGIPIRIEVGGKT